MQPHFSMKLAKLLHTRRKFYPRDTQRYVRRGNVLHSHVIVLYRRILFSARCEIDDNSMLLNHRARGISRELAIK